MKAFPLIGSVVFYFAWVFHALAWAQSLDLQVKNNQIYEGMPFEVLVVARDFEEDPPPTLKFPEIPGIDVQYTGMMPQVSSMTTIINGRMTTHREVTFVFQYQLTASKPGVYRIPKVVATQGQVQAQTQPISVRVSSIGSTSQMKVELNLPKRSLSVGERFPVTIDWLIRTDVGDHNFVVPFFQMADRFEIHVPQDKRGRTLDFNIGGVTLSLPYDQSRVVKDGLNYTRVRIYAEAMALKPGRFEIPPTQVMAQLQVGTRRDSWGFPVPDLRLFKAVDQKRVLEVRALPVSGKPASFAGAIGEGFEIHTHADRTVVAVGEPLTLTIDISGQGRLEDLVLPPLDADGGLKAEDFSFPKTPPTGHLIQNQGKKLKRFEVPLRLKNKNLREIPALAFSYFNPSTGKYHTVRSQPIALSVAGSRRVKASDVVDASEKEKSVKPKVSRQEIRGMDLSLSHPEQTLRQVSEPMSTGLLIFWHFLFLGVFGFGYFWENSKEARQRFRAFEKLRKEALQILEMAGHQEAAKVTTSLIQVLHRFAKEAEFRDLRDWKVLLEKVEIMGFDPVQQKGHLDEELLKALKKHVQEAELQGQEDSKWAFLKKGLPWWVILWVFFSMAWGSRVMASEIDQGREIYTQAMKLKGLEAQRAYARAAEIFQKALEENPNCPELWADLGQAALGAGEWGKAVWAYRKALQLDPNLKRAQDNLLWIQSTLPEQWVHRETVRGAMHSFFFINDWLDLRDRAWWALFFFGLVLLVWSPLFKNRSWGKMIRFSALIWILLWVWLLASLWVDGERGEQGVIVGEDVVLRAADSLGAPAVIREPLPSGISFDWLETRGDWVKIRLFNGTVGWIKRSWVKSL